MTAGPADRVLSGGDGARLSRAEAAVLLREMPLADLGGIAQELRFRRHPAREVTFVVDTNPNYTNVCETGCLFCPFYRAPGHPESFTLAVEDVVEKARQARAAGVTTMLLQGGLNPDLSFDYYLDLVREVVRQVPEVHPHFFSAPEVRLMAKVSGLSVRDVLEKLWQAGLRTLPGGGAEVLSDRVREKLSPAAGRSKRTVEEWSQVHRIAHAVGFRSTATMMYGHVEREDDIVAHLDEIRRIQDDTGGFTAFVSWSFKPNNTALARQVGSFAGPAVYLRQIAFSRIYLDNFDHIQATWFSEGRKTGQMALNFGADDFGGTLLEENVHGSAGHTGTATIAEAEDIIRGAGFAPVRRDTLYRRVRP